MAEQKLGGGVEVRSNSGGGGRQIWWTWKAERTRVRKRREGT